MRLHMIGLPHTQTVVEHMTVCAFTQKLVKFGEMMGPLGYDIVVYSGEHNDTPCAEHVPIFTDEQQRRWYGDHDPNLLPTIATWHNTDPHWVEMNHRAIAEISKRIEPDDLILLLAGLAQKPIADAFPNHISCEWAAGYSGIFAPYVCFESYAWMHFLYGHYFFDQAGGSGRWMDAVIPNYFRPGDFAPPDGKRDDYLLFVGRITLRKGPQTAAAIARASGRRLIVAGSGVAHHEPGLIRSVEGFEIRGDVEYAGIADVATRNELMANAHALIACSFYMEPFGAVVPEAQLCGTPTITPDWAAFTETNEDGVTGYRFRTLAEAVDAVEKVGELSAKKIRKRALERYSLEAVAPRYDRWLRTLDSLHRDGWYEGTGGPLYAVPPHAGLDVDVDVSGVPEAAEDAGEAFSHVERDEEHRFVVPDDAPHLGGYIAGGDPATQYPALWRWLVEKRKVRSVVDVGCGDGIALGFFGLLGCDVLGIDGVAQPDLDGSFVQHDFTRGPFLPDGPRRKFDLCWSCEFVEHVPAEFEGNYLAAFNQATKLLLMTHAMPGQPGHHHVNLQEPTYWIGLLTKEGWTFDYTLTARCRALAAENTDPNNHFVRSGLAFTRK